VLVNSRLVPLKLCCLGLITGHFNIYTREAGAGGLSIAVEGPSKAEIDFQDHKDGSCEVAYTCTEPGGWSHAVSLQAAACYLDDGSGKNLGQTELHGAQPSHWRCQRKDAEVSFLCKRRL